ncbi:MAG TPA: von Willebrand factor type A domain-containing protein, partial [Opitutaceae bacterium]|nr:von Willebrand factor type A domain-containing protein [Opitutaceae bacterium]
MNSPIFNLDDPRLTAYALGEMNETEREAFERELGDNFAAQTEIEAIRASAHDLTAALEQEPVLMTKTRAPLSRAKAVRVPYFLIASAAAACAGLLIWLRYDEAVRLHEAKRPVPSSAEMVQLQPFSAGAPDAAMLPADLSLAAKRDRDSTTAPAHAAEAVSRVRFGQDFAGKSSNAPAAALTGGLSGNAPQSVAGDMGAVGASTAHESMFRMAKNASDTFAAGPSAKFSSVGHGLPTEAYDLIAENDFQRAAQNPLSTFSADVDTASFANVRRFLEGNRLPPKDAVRIEELLNYFIYDYAAPKDTAPFSATMEVGSAPWAPEHRLVRIGLKGKDVSIEDRPTANLVFLLDTSGSMNEPNRLPLAVHAMRLLLEKLKPEDRVAIVTYAGKSGLALPSTSVKNKREIIDVLDGLEAYGSTNGGMGIVLAYDIAKANFIPDGINRVILCTDGDFNVGVTSTGELERLITDKAKSGVFLTALGFGMGNYKDATIRMLADKGNGNYGYIDSEREARKLLVDQVSGTLMTIAKDVKFQVEFNPAKVASYRLIGYEKRLLKKEDFNNDKADAGEVGAGHTVTALYEVVPAGDSGSESQPSVDPLKYQPAPKVEKIQLPRKIGEELLTLKIRYKIPNGDASSKLEFAVVDNGTSFEKTSGDFKFAASVAGFGMLLHDSPHKGTTSWNNVIEWAEKGFG